jgi:SHS family sialic acid transporter-like MFS transporter
MALIAAILGWLFDGLEMGLFPLIGRPALQELLGTTNDERVGLWFGVMIACFLVGAATGGVLFGWLGDRIGRVRAMTLSVLTYALFTGLCGFAADVSQLFVLRFIAALGMGGEWSLGISLVMEVWPNRSRAWLAGLIGAAANVGFVLIAVVSLGLVDAIASLNASLAATGRSEGWLGVLAGHGGWRLLMLIGAAPALLTFFIRLFVPESQRWLEEHARGTTGHWATRDLLGVAVGAGGPLLIVYLWSTPHALGLRVVGTVLGMVVALAGYLFPVFRFLCRSAAARNASHHETRHTVGRMLIGACLSGVALIGTWGAVQFAPTWAGQLTSGAESNVPQARAYTQIASGVGAIFGTIVAAVLGNKIGRRLGYSILCLGSLGTSLAFFQLEAYGPTFLAMAFLVGGTSASFYGWLPLYLPELFPTRVRATGQGFAYNFGRILAAIGALQAGVLVKDVFKGSYPDACSTIVLVYLVGVAIVWLAPETKGQPLPE